jgi:hypothetical protein
MFPPKWENRSEKCGKKHGGGTLVTLKIKQKQIKVGESAGEQQELYTQFETKT